MNWILLVVAGIFEVAFASCLGKAKESSGQTMWFWYVGFLICLTISMVLLVKVTKDIPIGTAYAVWTGIGAVGSVFVGIFIFHEPATFWRMFFLMTLIASIVGLKYVSE
ncbi:DMT family transporter [Flavobacterium okayamense]|uniref:Guanidinium exporter n=1 Tax=Flavobacterium okayamense TaxID=2830782 RepID=A0ABM7S3Y0_9FLAO|nr:multidrug efflux SMR transporter [Flavobacterium okayamense]BCY28213.1 QacE family quaternary ammonium compound efflux SMR transporter [Flavobacterium okayamense]